MSHGGANGFYFQDTMLLQSFGLIRGKKKNKERVRERDKRGKREQ